MTDCELLELAAKAAGICLHKNQTPSHGNWGTDYTCDDCGKDPYMVASFAPLNNDGDALRLAVAVPACIVIDNDMGWCGVHLNGSRGKYDLLEQFSNDKAAATRRAIVRAAAEIGKVM
jgi:hypothetical protein